MTPPIHPLTLLLLIPSLHLFTTAKTIPTYPEATKNSIQYTSYIDSTPKSDLTSSNIFSSSGSTTDFIYTFGDAISKLSTGAVLPNYNASAEPSILRFLPTGSNIPGVATDWRPIQLPDLSPGEGFTATYVRGEDDTPGIQGFARNDTLIAPICTIMNNIMAALEPVKGPTGKAMGVIEIDRTNLGGQSGMGELLISVESLASPIAGSLKEGCGQWLGDTITGCTSPKDGGVRSGWRVIGRGSVLARFGVGVRGELSH